MPRSTFESGSEAFILVVVAAAVVVVGTVTMVREEETTRARDRAARASGVTEHMNCSNAIDD